MAEAPGRGLPYGSGLGLSRCLGPGECLHPFIHSFIYRCVRSKKLKCTGVKDRMTKGCHELKYNYGDNKRKKKNGKFGRNKTTCLKTTVNKYIKYKY